MIAGAALPRTPKAALLMIIVGAEPRLPARDTNPTSRNDAMMPVIPAATACANDSRKPRRNAP